MGGGATGTTRRMRAPMEALLVSTGIIALAEIGDKTQLLALVLAARFRKPWPIVLGILVATLANHALAAALGAWITTVLGPDALRWILGLSFIAMAAWTLVPDRLDEPGIDTPARASVFGVTVVGFFLIEMGDKTQVATVALAAQYAAWATVVAGTTLGMLLANVPVVFVGHQVAARAPLALIRSIVAALFLAFGVGALLGADRLFGA